MGGGGVRLLYDTGAVHQGVCVCVEGAHTVIDPRRRGPGRNLMLCIVVALGGGGGGRGGVSADFYSTCILYAIALLYW